MKRKKGSGDQGEAGGERSCTSLSEVDVVIKSIMDEGERVAAAVRSRGGDILNNGKKRRVVITEGGSVVAMAATCDPSRAAFLVPPPAEGYNRDMYRNLCP